MKTEFLGTGTSFGVPFIGCSCPVCSSRNPKDKRLRSSILIYGEKGERILVDCGPEFRIQALRAGITGIDAVLITHPHADHIFGLDDLRIFSKKKSIPVYSNKETIEDLKIKFSYVITGAQPGTTQPNFNFISIDSPLEIGTVKLIPVPLLHGKIKNTGWRWENTAYLTDCNFIPETSFELLKGVKTLIIDSIRITPHPHPTHYCMPESLPAIIRINPEKVWYTHLGHDSSRKQIKEWVRQQKKKHPELRNICINPAWDGLIIPE